MGGYKDCAGIALGSNVQLLENNSYSFLSPQIGTKVTMRGAYSVSSGTVTNLNVVVNPSGSSVSLTLAKATYTCKHGDSGAAVFNDYNGNSSNITTCYGMQSVGFFDNGSEVSSYSYFMTANYIG